MKLSDIADDTELKLAGTSGDMEQKRKNTVSLPSDLNNITVKQTQAGDIADRNRRVENPRVQTGGLRPKDVAAAMKAAAVSGAGVNSNVWTAGAKAAAMRASSEDGTPYGATRPDSFSDATQNTNDALITNNPGDVHLGGIVSPGSKIYGELPKEDSAFYINQKFEEVEPFPIMMPDGNLYNSRTSNLNKAEWQFWSDKVSAPDMGWAGYFKVHKPEGEDVIQTAIRSAYNLIPEMTLRAGQYTATAINTASYLYDWIAKDHDRALENYNYYQTMIEDTVRDYMDATKWYYSDASEEGANKYAIIVGQTLGSVGIASLGARAMVAALALGEGLSDAASVQQATRELGYSPLASLGVGALAGGVTAGLSFLPEYVYPNELDNLAKKTGMSLLRLAVRSPGAIAKTVAQNGWRRVILEAGTEVGQELFADYASTGFDSEKMEARWDEKIAIILASLAMGGAGLYHNISKAKKGEVGLREFATKMTDMINTVEPELRYIASESGGLINNSNIDEILAHIKDPEFALQMTNVIREAIVGNFDKFTPEQKASLIDIVKSWKGDELLKGEFEKLEVRIGELLENSGLTPAQKNRFRTYVRGAAAWQLATLGIKPSEIELPSYVTNERPEEAVSKERIVGSLTNGLFTADRVNKIYSEVKSPSGSRDIAAVVDDNIKQVVSSKKDKNVARAVKGALEAARQEIIDEIARTVRVAGHVSYDSGAIYVSTRQANAPAQNVVDALKGVKTPANWPALDPKNVVQNSSADMRKAVMDGNQGAMDLTQSLGEVVATHEFTHWLQFNTGLHGVEEYMKALNEVVETIVPGLLKSIDSKSVDDKSPDSKEDSDVKAYLDRAEVYAHAMSLAGRKAAKVLGTDGYAADAMTFINQMLNASSMATKLGPELKAVYDFMHTAMKENQSMIEALLADIPYEQLRGAIRDFVETGDPKGMGLDAVRALHVVLNSIVNDTTSDMLHQAFGTRKNAENFMKATNDYYLKNNYEARVKAADEMAEKRAEANEAAGLPEQATPQAAPLMSEAFDRITSDGVVAEKDAKKAKNDKSKKAVDSTESKGKPQEEKTTLVAEEFERMKAEDAAIDDSIPDFDKKPSDKSEPKVTVKGEMTPRKRTQKDGEDYDVDRMDLRMMGDAELVNYIKHSAHWLHLEQITPPGQELWSSPRQYHGWWERTAENMSSRLNAIEGYVVRGMAQARERGLTKDPKIRKELEDANIDKGLFAIIEIEPLFTSGITDALAEIPADKRTKAEQSLYAALSRYELDSNIYTDYEVLPALDAIGRRIENAESLDAKLSMIVADPKSRAQGYINTLTRMIDSHVTKLSEKKSDILAHESMIADGILEPDYAGTEDDRTRIQKQYDQSVALSKALYQEAKEMEKDTSGISAKEKDSLVQKRAELMAKASYLKAMVNDGLTPSDLDADSEIIEWAQRVFDRYLSGKKTVSEKTGKGKRTKTVLREVDLTEEEFEENANTVLGMAAEMESEARAINRKINKAEAAFSLYDQYAALEKKALAGRILERAVRTKEKAERTAAAKTKGNRFSYYFTPKYDSDFSSQMIGVKMINSSYAFLRSSDATDAQKEVVRDILSQNAVLSSYINPARTFGKRPLLDTPSPLEEMNISVDEAVDIIRGGGLRPFEIDKSIIADSEEEINNFIGKSYNLGGDSAPKTRSRIYAKLIDFMLHEDFNMGEVAASNDAARQMQVLLAIHEAKHLANDLFANYIGREQSFDKHPSLEVIPESTFRFMKSPRWKPQMLEQKNTHGYTVTELSNGLLFGDSIAFPYGTIFIKGVVAVAGRTPSGAMTYVIRKDLSDEDIKMVRENLAEAKKLYAEAVKAKEGMGEPADVEQKFKDARQAALKAKGIMKLGEKVLSAEELRRVPVFRKPIGPANYKSSVAHFKALNRLYDEALPILGRHNLAQVAVMSLKNKQQDVFDSVSPLKKEIAEELSAFDSPIGGLFALDLFIERGDESGATKFIDDVDSKIAALNDRIKAVDSSIHNESYFDDWEGFQANKPESVAAEEAARNKAFAELREYDAEMERLQEQRKSFFANYTPAKRDAFIKERSRVEKEMAAISDRFVPFFKSFGPGLATSDVDLLIESLEGRYDIGFQDDAGNIMPASVVRTELPENLERIKQLNTYSNALQDAMTYGGTFANLANNVPELDPGLFAIIGGTLEDDMATYERAMTLEQEYVAKGQWYDGKVERDAIMSAEFARRDEQMKPKLAEAAVKPNEHGVSFMDQLRALGKAVKEVKTPKWLYFLGSGSGTDRKGRLLFGKVWDENFGLSKAYSSAQQYRESRVHAMDEAAVSEVFGGSRRAYDKWRAEIKAERFDARVNGVDVKISRGEIMSIYAMKLAVEKYSAMNNQFARLRKYENIDELLSHLTAEDKAFVDVIALTTMNAMRGGVSTIPKDWVPAVEMNTYMKDGWAGRRKSKVNNDRGLIDSETSLAAMDLYDSVVSTISRYATHASGLMVQLDSLRQILAFAGVDKSQYREFDEADRKTYDEIMEKSVALREAIAKKIGNAQAKWFLQGIEYDLANDPLSDDIGTTPGMEWFAKLTRGASSAALSLNLKQAIQNFGNYHRFFGLSGSGAIKFYTADWINSVAHIREAWKLAMENPEFKRRFEQAGLSEHMRRIADVNQSSFLSELQTKLFEKGKDGASNMVSALNSLSSMGTKWGLATNVLPDIVGIALGNYAVWNDVLAKNDGNVAAAQREIADFVNNRISSSNYMTQSLLKKRLNKMGLGALVMFQSDQLQSFGTMAEAWSTFMNSKDPDVRARAKKDVVSFFVSMGRYIAIKAGWVGAIVSTAVGRDLSDEEWDYIYDSTAYELVAQMGGWSQFNNMGISPFIRSLLEGEKFGPSIVTTSAIGRAISGARKTAKGDMRGFVDLISESLAMSGIAPAFPGLLRIMDGIFKLASDNEHERDVGIKQILGSSETGAMQQLGLSKSQNTGEIRPKKKLKKDGE